MRQEKGRADYKKATLKQKGEGGDGYISAKKRGGGKKHTFQTTYFYYGKQTRNFY